ncbi:hypothetical protein [Pseudarthrobacter sp. H2]|uniref:hypothetical protein n=1 Tax=Pseudarthrobacter sp. H2 TaxID=3418415 RepID=UPI003CEB0722
MVETVVPIPALRERSADVMPLARYAARQTRLREVDFTPAAEHALTTYGWPGNVDELFSMIRDAALRTETTGHHRRRRRGGDGDQPGHDLPADGPVGNHRAKVGLIVAWAAGAF